MSASRANPGEHESPHAPRYRIEKAGEGYRVVGDQLHIWEPTFREAASWRDQLESPGYRHRLRSFRGGGGSPLFGRIVYGPVRSRRFGCSLGINLCPADLCVCTFDCAYCEFGRARRVRGIARWPAPWEIGADLARTLALGDPVDSITISGHGEPTLHPAFAAAVAAVRAASHRERPGVPVRILTNGTGAVRAQVRRALDSVDERIVKLDAGTERVNRPPRAQPLGALLLAWSLLRDFTVQSCFIEGEVSNTDEDTVQGWIDLLGEIRPVAVEIYTIDRPSAKADVHPAAAALLEEIRSQVEKETGLDARAYF